MFLASKVGNKELQKPTFFSRKIIVVVSAASYRCLCPKSADEDTKSSGSRTPDILPRTVSLETLMKGLMSCFLGWHYPTVRLPCRRFLLHGANKGLASSCLYSSLSCAQHLQMVATLKSSCNATSRGHLDFTVCWASND
jgi:hypothetical protein